MLNRRNNYQRSKKDTGERVNRAFCKVIIKSS